MLTGVQSVLSFFSDLKNLEILVIVLTILSLTAFILTLFLTIFCRRFNRKFRIIKPVTDAIIFLVGWVLSQGEVLAKTVCVLLLCLNVVLCLIVLLLPQKTVETSKEEKEFVKLIDDEIKKQDSIPTLKPVLEKIMVKPREAVTREKTDEMDYSHVKNILERLEFYPLTQADKKQVRELEVSLLEAEKGNGDIEVKTRINDGLGDLLKIMSKYGV